jgi:sugar/nucleoside kinase (ribokinase family)
MNKLDVVGLGFSATDILIRVPSLTKVPKGCTLLGFDKQGGGPVATAMVTLSRLGARAGVISKVGNEEYGSFILSEFSKENVDASNVIIEKDGVGPIVVVLVEDLTAERVFLLYSNISEIKPEQVNFEYISQAKILHLDGMSLKAAQAAADFAKKNDVIVSFDMGSWSTDYIELIRKTDILIPSEKAAFDATQKTNPVLQARKLKNLGPKIVAITLGNKGSIYVDDKVVRKPAFNIQAIDTTGAGDVYHGAFLFGILKNWNPDRITEFANAVAAIKCMKLGGRKGIPTFMETQNYLKKEKTKKI